MALSSLAERQLRAAMASIPAASEIVTILNNVAGIGALGVRASDGKLLWSRTEHHRFPDIKELKQLVRDQVAPERALGHSDAKPAQS